MQKLFVKLGQVNINIGKITKMTINIVISKSDMMQKPDILSSNSKVPALAPIR
jgi:hypothetical protein